MGEEVKKREGTNKQARHTIDKSHGAGEGKERTHRSAREGGVGAAEPAQSIPSWRPHP